LKKKCEELKTENDDLRKANKKIIIKWKILIMQRLLN